MVRYAAVSKTVGALIRQKQARLVVCGHICQAFGFMLKAEGADVFS